MRLFPLLVLISGAAVAADWKILFDGKSLAGWRDPGKLSVPGTAWKVEDGCLKATKSPQIHEDLFSNEEFTDFELEFEWKVAPGGNSGVKYRLQDAVFLNESVARPNVKKFEDTVRDEYLRHPSDRKTLKPGERGQLYTVAFELQLIDDQNYKGGLKDNQHTGSLYSFLAPIKAAAKPAGEWNTGRLVVKGDHVEHWINGEKVLEASLRSPAIAAGSNARWGADHPVTKLLVEQPKKKSPILLQNHGDEAWFRKLRIRGL